MSDLQENQKAFWTQLLSRATRQGVHHHPKRDREKLGKQWIKSGAGQTGLGWVYIARRDGSTAVQLSIEKPDKQGNKAVFDKLSRSRNEIEEAFGDQLQWERKDELKESRIRYTLRLGGTEAPQDHWPYIQDKMIGAMDRLVAAIEPHIG